MFPALFWMIKDRNWQLNKLIRKSTVVYKNFNKY